MFNKHDKQVLFQKAKSKHNKREMEQGNVHTLYNAKIAFLDYPPIQPM